MNAMPVETLEPRRPDYLILASTIALLVLGTLMVYSASFVVALNRVPAAATVSAATFATALNAQGKRAEATAQLLEIVRRDRKWNEDGARKQLVQLFEAWGPADEATVEGRKRLSTILFS